MTEQTARMVWAHPMRPRDTTEQHRAATPLELLFDLCFVVAVAAVSDRLHHALTENHTADGIIAYLMVFFGVWWAWMNFTWFASAYDCNDIAYRLTTFVQISGVLVLAAGVARAFDQKDFAVIVVGYAVMRVGLVTQWLRAARGDAPGRRTALRFAAGVSACMVGWAALLFVPTPWFLPGFLVMAAAELAVPLWAERAHHTPWHPHHIAERYGLFTIIVLGETVLAATLAVRSGFDGGAPTGTLLAVAACGLVVVFGMWWLYFGQRADRFLRSNREGFRWGYGHYLIFASAAAVGAGIGVVVDHETHVGHAPGTTVAAAVAAPVAVFLLCVWLLHVRPRRPAPGVSQAFPATAGLVLVPVLLSASGLAEVSALASLGVTALLVAGLVVVWAVAGED
jgi:low temperature requirement protein LtrA